MESVMWDDRLVLFVGLVGIGITGVFHQEKVGCMGRFAEGRKLLLSTSAHLASIKIYPSPFSFLTVILSYCAAEHVNCSVASFQSSDFTVQMSCSTWQWPFSWWRQDWLICLFIYFAFGVCGLQAKFLSMQATSFCSVCSIHKNKTALRALCWTFIKSQLFKHGIMNYFPNGQTQSACYRENKRLV